MIKCKKCNIEFEKGVNYMTAFSEVPINCDNCGCVTWAHNEAVIVNNNNEVADRIPDIVENTVVAIVNKEHDRYLQLAIIVDRDHVHYRVEFSDLVKMWVPEHWVKHIRIVQ